MNCFEQVIEQVALLDLMQHYLTAEKLRKTGNEYSWNPCPFCGHNDCFKVNPSKNLYHCFSCGQSGNAISFVQQQLKLAPLDAAKEIARVCALKIDFNSNGKYRPDAQESKKAEIFQAAADFYRHTLLGDAKALKILLDTRKYGREFIEQFPLIGYTGNQWGLLYHYLSKSYSESDLLASGLIVSREGKTGDFFGPQYFVFFHVAGKEVCDFTLKDALKHSRKRGEERTEYRLQAEHRLKPCLFNQDALNGNPVFFCEGQNDVLQILNADPRACPVAEMKNLADEERVKQIRQRLKGKTVYLCFDKDDAGDRFTQKAFEQFWGDCNLQVLDWPRAEAKDIDEWLRRQPDRRGALELLKKSSVEVFDWLLSHTIEEPDDRYSCLMMLKPFTDRFGKVADEMLIQSAIESIRKRFSDPSIAKIIGDTYRKEKFTREASGASSRHLPYFEKDGLYFRRQGKGDIGLSNFVLRISDIVRIDEEIYYRCTLNNDQADSVPDVVFNAGERSNARKFRERCASKGAFYFTGTDGDLAGIWQLEESRQAMQKTFYIKHYGEIPQEGMWLFDNCAIKDGVIHEKNEDGFIRIGPRNYRSYDVLVYSGAVPRLDLKTEYTQEFAQRIADAFHVIMDSKSDGRRETYRGYMFFGALPAIIYSREIFARFGFFPFLFSYGQPNTGKTQVTSRLLECFGFITSPESWPGATEPGTYQFLQALSSMPCWYDEFLNDKTFEKLFGTIKNVYNRSGSGKGGLEKRTIREINGCLWLSGEDTPNNEAVLSRSVIFRFDPINDYKTEAYTWLTDQKKNLSVLARQLILSKSPENAAKFIKQIENIAEIIKEYSGKIETRVAINHAIFAAGLIMLNIETPEDYYQYVIRHSQAGSFQKLTESPVYQFFSELSYLFNRSTLLHRSVRYEPYTNELSVHFPSAIKIIQREMRSRGENLKIKADSIRDYLKDLEACVDVNKRVHFGGNYFQRCLVFELDRLPETIKDVAEFYASKEEDSTVNAGY